MRLRNRFALLLPALLAAALCACAPLPAPEGALFSWRRAAVTEEGDALLADMRAAGLGMLFQTFSSRLAEGEAAAFLQKAEEAGIEVYLLAGAPEWALEPGGETLRDEIARAAAINEAADGAGLQGVVADVEPYLLPEWDEDAPAVMEVFVSCMAAAREAAREAGLTLILCIPYYYDTQGHEAALESIMRDGCDGVAVMNYYRGKELAHIQTEAALAKKLGRTIWSVYELKPAGSHGLVEENTYYEAGLPKLWENAEALRREHPSLGFALHDYEAWKEVRARE